MGHESLVVQLPIVNKCKEIWTPTSNIQNVQGKQSLQPFDIIKINKFLNTVYINFSLVEYKDLDILRYII